MNLKKLIAAVSASVIAVSAMSVAAYAADAETGKAGYAAIAFASGDWNAQYWLKNEDYATVASDVTVTGSGTYTVTIDAKTAYIDEDTGDDVVVDGATGLAFAALEIEQGETLFPGMIVTINSVKVDGKELPFSGTPYTSSDENITTRVNLYNEWVSSIPDDARTIDGLAADASATPISNDLGEWSKMEVNFTVTLPGETIVAISDTAAPAAGDVAAATDSSKGSPDTGVADVAAVAGLAVAAAGAFIISKKRK